MNAKIPPRLTIRLAVLAAVIAVSALVWRTAYVQAIGQLVQRSEADLALASDRLRAQLQRYQELAVLMADHPVLDALASGRGSQSEAQELLLAAADKTGALDLVFAATDGRVLAAARAGQSPSSLASAPHFQRALHGALGASQDRGGIYARRAFHYAAPGFAPDGPVRAVLVVSVNVDALEDEWRGDRPAIYFVDASRDVFISNRSELLFWRQDPATGILVNPDAAASRVRRANTGGFDLWQVNWGPYLPRRALHLTRPLPVIDMQAEALVDIAPARRLAFLQTAAVAAATLFFAALLLQAIERRRVLAEANAVLESRVLARTAELSEANKALRHEVRDRLEAEAALRQAQAELVQAGKLSALGQMSAGISHELNQPLMAIRQFAENGETFLERGKTEAARDNLSRISGLAARAARIIRNLRAFARNENEPMGRVDLVQVIDTTVELTEARLRAETVQLTWQRPALPVYVQGGEVRLVQVFVNLVNNAADAMAGQGDKRIAIAIGGGSAGQVVVRVSDTGPGIVDPEKIFEPFYTTKEVGSAEGMGLGLSISYGLVQSFGGKIKGTNAPGGGAVFAVELEPWRAEVAA